MDVLAVFVFVLIVLAALIKGVVAPSSPLTCLMDDDTSYVACHDTTSDDDQ